MAGLVEPWAGRIVGRAEEELRYRGTPGMSAICRGLANGMGVRFDTRVERLTPCGNGWGVDGEGWFDAVLVAPPRSRPRPVSPSSVRSAHRSTWATPPRLFTDPALAWARAARCVGRRRAGARLSRAAPLAPPAP